MKTTGSKDIPQGPPPLVLVPRDMHHMHQSAALQQAEAKPETWRNMVTRGWTSLVSVEIWVLTWGYPNSWMFFCGKSHL